MTMDEAIKSARNKHKIGQLVAYTSYIDELYNKDGSISKENYEYLMSLIFGFDPIHKYH